MSDNDEFIREFLDESRESLDQLDQDFVALENTPDDQDRLANVFRTIHTIKGTSGFFNYSKLGAIAHAGENLLGLLRDGVLRLDQEIASGLLQCVDSIREVLAEIESTGTEGTGDYRTLNEELALLAKREQPALDVESESIGSAPPPEPEPTVAVEPTQTEIEIPAAKEETDAQESAPASAPTPVTMEPDSQPVSAGGADDTFAETPHLALERAAEAASKEPVPEPSATKPGSSPRPQAASSVRVDVRLLDDLMMLVGELVLARNQLLQFSSEVEDRHYQGVSQRVNQITSELQDGIMKTRMQPIGTMWSKFPRVVRDLAVNCNKEVRLVMEGQETELDRTLLEAIKDPLTHLIRNSIDHGIETPEIRKQREKDPEGTLLLRSFHEGGLVNIEITDDGGGISVEKVRDKAISREILTAEKSRRMTDDELVQLIFRPGFSTAEQVTDVSGRGVGMDVVRTNIERIGGSIDLKNRPGMGTTVRVKIPLTLAIIPAMMVSCQQQSFAIPQASVVEMLSLMSGDSKKSVEFVNQTPVVRLRGKILPLIILEQQLNLDETKDYVRQLQYSESIEVIVLQADQLQFGLVVDSIRNAEEIVVKPLDSSIAALRVYSGATILGDGRVALILDVTGLAARSLDEADLKQISDKPTEQRTAEALITIDDSSLLLCGLDSESQIALPLSQVHRLEEIEAGAVQQSTSGTIVHCRGVIMPVVHLAQTLGRSTSHFRPDISPDLLQVVVTVTTGTEMALVVDSILDVVSCPLANRTLSKTSGLIGHAMINDQLTDIVDLAGLFSTESKW